ncbi:winged helix-turn-helix domain-containing protein [Streptomyces rishiriensis]|uniref:winged helix-turn-helix domain-containing protein n=1 Tax=Streptomyces rishiriensis TaxID=68264 RepID=UPI001C3F88C9|nr:winged helix-turn-helix domain-containing protein [Streptomyces rishiriensis]
MIRIRLGARGLGGVRFAVSPMGSAKDLLRLVGFNPGTLTPSWRSRATDALTRHRLGLLAVVGGGGPLGYAPDFLRPEPPAFLTDIDTALHQIATTPQERIRYELAEAVNGHSWDPGSGHPAPRQLLQALGRGEDHFARRLADEMARFWHAALKPSWPAIRTRLEADVTARASDITQYGLAEALNRLAPNLEWRGGELLVHLRTDSIHRLTLDAEAVILTPSVFVDRALFCAGEPPGTPAPRTPLIVYPAAKVDCLPPAQDPLIGATRRKLLAELSQPRSTTEIAKRLYLSPATVSYHLQILHRAGLVTRARRSRHVLYQRLGGMV